MIEFGRYEQIAMEDRCVFSFYGPKYFAVKDRFFSRSSFYARDV